MRTRGFRCDWCATERVSDDVPKGWTALVEDDPHFAGTVTLHFCSPRCWAAYDARQPVEVGGPF